MLFFSLYISLTSPCPPYLPPLSCIPLNLPFLLLPLCISPPTNCISPLSLSLSSYYISNSTSQDQKQVAKCKELTKGLLSRQLLSRQLLSRQLLSRQLFPSSFFGSYSLSSFSIKIQLFMFIIYCTFRQYSFLLVFLVL